MPELSRFFGIVIGMYYREHPPPHFHAKYAGQKGVFNIDTLEMVEGELPNRVRALVLEWAAEHREELRKNWEASQSGKHPTKIEPLQ
jgi:hypothetical protein